MTSQDPEPRPDETTPLLRSSSDERDDAPRGITTTASGHDDVTEEITVVRGPEFPSNYKIIFTGFVISLVAGFVTLAFLFTEHLLAEIGREKYNFSDSWRMSEIRIIIFWACMISIVFSISNIICLKRTRKPFSAIVNAVALGMFTFMISNAIGEFIDNLRYPPTYCYPPRKPSHGYPDYPEDPDDDYPGGLESWSSRSFEECQKWAPKVQVFKQILLYVTAFYGVILSVLFIVILYDAIRVTTRFFPYHQPQPWVRSLQNWANRFEVSFKWGSPQHDGTTRHQSGEEAATSE